ncbi:nitrogen fixation protein NifM [uncultured Thiodictyon sp.]|uniref:nitrogen fixation protein NifM n=1 Tax=uncultured Thiodictyon sp. TaxID=1846217 RepID=UPI0026002404|nr:nitrogen fixation protein NifM [uncultured Thiodictyon sp.]
MGQSDSIAISTDPITDRPEFRYHLLRAAGERFKAGLADLAADRLAEVTQLARRTFELECLVLGSKEARDLLIPATRVEAAVAELRGRYADAAEFAADLQLNGLDLATLRLALRRELMFDGAMQRVAAGAVAVTELDERLFYEVHPERFSVPERRTASHLLITVNDDFAENRRDAALARIEQFAERLQGPPGGRDQRFAALAREHSECPTAIEGGRLGEVVPGQLFPALDAALFALAPGEIGGPVESEMGFHLLLCERVQPARSIPFAEIQPQIRQLLQERAGRRSQQAWIGALRQRPAMSAGATQIEEAAA